MRTAGPIAHPAVRGLPPRVTMARPRARTTPATLPPQTTVTAAMRARTNQATGQRPPTGMAALPAPTTSACEPETSTVFPSHLIACPGVQLGS